MNKSRVASAVLLIMVALPLDAQTPSPGTYSAAVYDVLEERGHLVPMRDGVRLSVDIYRPDDPELFPGILTITPYDNTRQRDRARCFANRGYMVV